VSLPGTPVVRSGAGGLLAPWEQIMAKKSTKGKSSKAKTTKSKSAKGKSKKGNPVIEKTRKSIADAKKLGVDVKVAEEALREAEELLEAKKEKKAKEAIKEINNIIRNAKKKKRLERMILNTLPTLDEAKQAGGEVDAAEEWLDKAKEKLEEGIFGTAQEYINNARREAEDAKRFVTTRELIAQFATDIEAAKRKGADITHTMELVMKAWEELRAKRYGQVKNLMREAKKELTMATESKEFVDMVKLAEERMQVVKDSGFVTMEMWGYLKDAKEKLEAHDYADVRRNVRKIEDRLDKVVLLKRAGLTIRTIQQFTNEAKRSGLKSEELDRLLDRASSAFEEGRFEEMDEIQMSAQKVVKNLRVFDKLSTDDIRLMDDDTKELFANWTTQEIQDSMEDLERAARRGDDVSKIQDLIEEAQSSLSNEDYESAFEAVQAAKSELGTGEGQVRRVRVEEIFETYQGQLQDALEIGMDVREVQGMLDTAKMMMDKGSLDEANVRLDQFGESIKEKAKTHLKGKYPRIQVSVEDQGLEKERWNRVFVSVINTGETAARDLELSFPGDVDVKGETTVPKLIQNEEKELELALMPYMEGDVPLEISATYQRYFDDTKYQLNDIKTIEVDQAGSYIVEDVFLIHRSGILVARETRRFEADVDSDVFSGMLTAVIQFVKDSFGLPAETSLNRMEFGDNKLLIERGADVFLAITVLGEESEFLPFYMTEILKEVEDTFGEAFRDWTGDLTRFEGIEEIIRKLIFTKEDRELELAVMPSSTLSPAIKAIAADAENTEIRENLFRSVKVMNEELNTRPYGEVVNQIIAIESQLREALSGMDLQESEESRMDTVIRDSVRSEIEAFSELLAMVQAQGLDIEEEEGSVGQVRGLFEGGDYEGSRSVLERAKGSIKRKQNAHRTEKLRARITSLEEQMEFAGDIGVDVGEFEPPLGEVKERLDKGDLSLDPPLTKIERGFQEKMAGSTAGKSPNLQVELRSDVGLQKEEWSPVNLELSNTGDMPARNIDIKFPDNVKVKYLDFIESLKPNERKRMELAVKTAQTGSFPIEIKAEYQRYFDPTKYQLSKLSNVNVEDPGSFVIDDVFLIHKTGILIAKETRRIKEVVDSDVFSGMLTVINQFVKDSFEIPRESALHSLEFGDSKVLLERGDHVFLALSIAGQESPFLPLYMAETITLIETDFGSQFEEWSGNLEVFEGIEQYLRDLVTIKMEDKVEVPLCQSSLLAPAVRAVVDGKYTPMEFSSLQSKLTDINTNVSREGFEAISSYLAEVQQLLPVIEAMPSPTDAGPISLDDEELKRRMHNLLLKADITFESAAIIDDKLNVYLEAISGVRDKLDTFRREQGMEDEPVPHIAIQHSEEELWREIIGTIKTVVKEQLKVAEVEAVGADEHWSGLDIKVKVNEDLIKAKYRHIAPNIISVLKYMPGKKMVESLSRPEFTIGVEGQTIYVEKDMVEITYSVPEGVEEVPFDGGTFYVTLKMTREAETKMAANSIVERIIAMREAMELEGDAAIDVQIVAPDAIADELDQMKDELSKETGAYAVELPFDDPFDGDTDYYVSELEYKGETIKIGIIEVEFEE